MRIVQLTYESFGPGRRGGGERYFNEFGRALLDEPLDVKFFEVPKLNRAAVVDIRSGERHPVSIANLWRTIRAADLVHVHQLNTFGFDHALLSTIGASTALVLTDHGGGALTPGRAFGAQRNHFVDGLAAVSDWSRRDVDLRGRIPEHAIIGGGGDHVLREAPSRTTWKPCDFLFVGRMTPHKGLHVVIQGLPRGASLRVVGEPRDAEYAQYVRSLAAGKDVEFSGSPSDDDLRALYESARYLVFPSVNSFRSENYSRPELLGLVILESLACGTPVIGSDIGGAAQLLRAHGQQTVPAGVVHEWTLTMERAMRSDEPVAKLDVSWRSTVKKAAMLYDRVRRM